MSDLGAPYTPAEEHMTRIFDRLHQRIGAIIMTSAEDAVNRSTEQLGKAKTEIDSIIADLQGQAVSGDAMQRLQNISQALDDVVPDQPAPESSP